MKHSATEKVLAAESVMCDISLNSRPRIVAHRHGNSKKLLRKTLETQYVDEIECDVWLHDGKLVVRHKKRIRWFPFAIERWHRGLVFHNLIQELSLKEVITMTSESEKCLVLDVKGASDRTVSTDQFVLSLLNVLPPKLTCAVHSKDIVLLEAIRRESHAKNVRCPQLFYSLSNENSIVIHSDLFKTRAKFFTGITVKKNIAKGNTETLFAFKKDLGLQVYIWTIRTKKEFYTTLRDFKWVDGIITDWIPKTPPLAGF